MSPLYVRPYVTVHKNDDRDAAAIALEERSRRDHPRSWRCAAMPCQTCTCADSMKI